MSHDASSSPVRAAPSLRVPPLVGRDADLAALAAALDAAAGGQGGTVLLAGEGGVGKTRLATAAAELAGGRGWTVATGRAYPVESGVPYALFADAFVPRLRALDAAALQVLTRGGAAELAALFPALAPAGEPARPAAAPRGDPAEAKARLFWSFAQLLSRLSARAPLLAVLENLQWADESSLELLHFVARQLGGDRVLLLCTYNDADRERNPALRGAEKSLVALGAARVQRVDPLGEADTARLVARSLGASGDEWRALAASVHAWTRGNPFFIEETLKALAESGRLQAHAGAGLWREEGGPRLPRSVRDAVAERLSRLSDPARGVATWAAVVGTRTTHDAMRAITALDDGALLSAVDELRGARILEETADAEGVIRYDFAHPILRDTLYAELGLARSRALHASVAESLERLYGDRSLEHAGELAAHVVRADTRALATKAVRYLAAAGREALRASANREAASYLTLALELRDREGVAVGPEPDVPEAGELAEALARARQRLGEYDAAMPLWRRARDEAERAGDLPRVAAMERRMGLASYWSGRYEDALGHYAAGLAVAGRAGDAPLAARLDVARGMCLQELGRGSEAIAAVEEALAIAERERDPALLGRVHRALLLLRVWTGPPDEARRHGERALALAAESSQPALAWSAHWAMALLGGLTGDSASAARHLAASEELATALRSPVLGLWSAEVAIEYASGVGDWERALALAERSIPLARSLAPRTLLPRLLVWAGLLHLGRGDLAVAWRHFDESWLLAVDDGRRAASPLDVHTLIPAHVGLASYHLAAGERDRAIEVGEAGLAVAERSGYVAWAVHRLLPVLAESALWMADLGRARRYGARLREAAQQLDHRLGLAWADACDALVAMLSGDVERAVGMLRGAADALDAVPFVLDGARLRRFLARALAESGDREGATRELRRVHDVFARLGAARELTLTREQLRLLGARPPARGGPAAGADGLTARELEICRLVAERKSNREIGEALDISPRTVSTHLSNIFAKVGLGSRGELTDWVRTRG
ncbi:MAG: AAA family ATPase [Gemmatimonadaceae bacterium]